jgi:hypothetical protein
MLADKTMAVEDAVKRIGEINAEYEARRKELTEVPKWETIWIVQSGKFGLTIMAMWESIANFMGTHGRTAESVSTALLKIWKKRKKMTEIKFSEQRNELFTALAKARKAFKPVIKRSSNPFFKSKYADLAEILDATVDSLSDNGLSVLQLPSMDESGHVVITTVIGHSSGQWMEGSLPMPVSKADAQGTGSAITYGRRYALGALLNVASELDDDAEAAVGRTKTDAAEGHFMEKTGQVKASEPMVRAFQSAFKTSGKTDAQLTAYLRTRYSANSAGDLTSSELSELVKWAVSKEPLAETLRTSVEAAQKPQETRSAGELVRTLVSNPEAPGKALERILCRPTEITSRKTKPPKNQPYLILECSTDQGTLDVFSWDTKINEYLFDARNKPCIFDIERNPKGISLKRLVEVDRITFNEKNEPDLSADFLNQT